MLTSVLRMCDGDVCALHLCDHVVLPSAHVANRWPPEPHSVSPMSVPESIMGWEGEGVGAVSRWSPRKDPRDLQRRFNYLAVECGDLAHGGAVTCGGALLSNHSRYRPSLHPFPEEGRVRREPMVSPARGGDAARLTWTLLMASGGGGG